MESKENNDKVRYPIGEFHYGKEYTIEQIKKLIERISLLPEELTQMAAHLREDQLNQTYRSGGWNARQLFNHYIDVYLNAFLRTKWLISENGTLLKPYDESKFVLIDGSYKDIKKTLQLFECLIDRWVDILNNLPENIFSNTIVHPEYGVELTLKELIAMYEWHGYHHLAHLKMIKNAS